MAQGLRVAGGILHLLGLLASIVGTALAVFELLA